MTSKEFIVSRAAMGWSKNMVLGALNISEHKFRKIVNSLPKEIWSTSPSFDRIRFYESQKGYCSSARKQALELATKTRQKQFNVQIGSLNMTIPQFVQLYKEEVTVSLSTVNRRLSLKWNIYDALFLGKQPSAAVLKHGHFRR